MTPGSVTPQQLETGKVLIRFIIRVGGLAAFALFAKKGFVSAGVELCALAAIICVVMAFIRGETASGPSLSHWDEASFFAFFAALGAMTAAHQ